MSMKYQLYSVNGSERSKTSTDVTLITTTLVFINVTDVMNVWYMLTVN